MIITRRYKMKAKELEQEAKDEITAAQKEAVKREIKLGLKRLKVAQEELTKAEEAYGKLLEQDVDTVKETCTCELHINSI